MPRYGIILLLLCVFGGGFTPAKAELNDKLTQQRYGVIASGDFSAGDNVRFTLSQYHHNEYLMHFDGEPELFVLYGDFSSLGGRVLRYDSGAVAIRITGWGALTVYTDDHPDGLPVDRIGKPTPMALPEISQSELLSRAEDESAHLAYIRSIHVRYTADWADYADDAEDRKLLYDTLENTARAIMRFTAEPDCQAAFGRNIHEIHLATSRKPTIQYRQHVLTVTFNPHDKFAGRASSRAIAYALGKMFHIPFPK